MSPTLFEGLHFYVDPPATLGGRCVAPMAKKKLGRGNENGIMMTEQHVGREYAISQSFSSTSASRSLVDGSGAFMTESINSALFSRGKLPSQSSAFSTIGSGFNLPSTPYSVSSSILSYNRQCIALVCRNRRGKMFSKVLKKKIPSCVNAKQRRNFLGVSRLVHHTKKKKNRHPVTSYGGPIRRWPTKKRSKISSLIRLRTDDIALNEGHYSTKSANKQEDKTWDFAATSLKHKVGFGTKGMESLSKDFVSDQAPSTASDFVHITNAGDGDLLLRPWSQRNQKAFQRKPSLGEISGRRTQKNFLHTLAQAIFESYLQ